MHMVATNDGTNDGDCIMLVNGSSTAPQQRCTDKNGWQNNYTKLLEIGVKRKWWRSHGRELNMYSTDT
jgi:hypothetical protein